MTLYTAQAGITIREVIGDTTQVSNKSELYEVYQDQDYIYLSMNTADPKMMMSMLRQGVTVYYDMKGKKKRKVSVTYPVRDGESSKQRQNRPLKQSEERSEPDEERLYTMIHNQIKRGLPQEAMYSYHGDAITFNIKLNSQDIEVTYVYDSENQLLNYLLKMPKAKISNDPKANFSKLTIGVTTPERPTNNREGGNGQNARIGGGNNQRGGGPAGGGRSGGSGGPRGGGQKRPSQQGSSGAILNFWFKAEI